MLWSRVPVSSWWPLTVPTVADQLLASRFSSPNVPMFLPSLCPLGSSFGLESKFICVEILKLKTPTCTPKNCQLSTPFTLKTCWDIYIKKSSKLTVATKYPILKKVRCCNSFPYWFVNQHNSIIMYNISLFGCLFLYKNLISMYLLVKYLIQRERDTETKVKRKKKLTRLDYNRKCNKTIKLASRYKKVSMNRHMHIFFTTNESDILVHT